MAAGADGRADLQEAVDAVVRPELLSQLRGRWRRADREDAIVMGVDDALLKYFMNPMLYVPGRGDAVAWFLRIARNKVLDAFRRQGRPEKVERALGVRIEEAVPETAQAASSDAESRDVKNRELLARLLLAAHTNAERRYLRLKFSGASLAGQAAALGAATVPPSAQRVVVHRAWGRIKRRAERHGMIVPRRGGRRCA
ncbi:MAG TPA: hypothetical protein VLD59_14065 [Steroidobacteraceae bacterium]|nr:hypothetical protein [Steroidobacteraceae bacterium]